jgi:hypothetical protein
MKRSAVVLGAVLAVLLIAGAGAGWMIGARAEEGYRAGLAEFNGHVMWGELENVSYKRGLFRSKAQTVLRVEDAEFAFEHSIYHSPRLRVRIETRFAPSEELLAFIVEQSLAELLENPIVTEIHYTGRSSTTYLLPPFDRELTETGGEQVTIQCGGLELTVHLSADLKDFGVLFNFPFMRVAGNGGLLELRAISSEFDTRQEQGLPLGRTRMDMEIFSFELDQEPRYISFNLQGLKMMSHSDIADEFYGGVMRLDARQLILGGQSFGPLEFELTLENLAVSPLQRLQAGLESFKSQNGDFEEAQLQMLLTMGEIIPELLGYRPRLVLKTIGMRGEGGDLRGEGLATFEGDLLFLDPQLLLGGLVATFDLDLSRSLLSSLILSGQYLQAERRPGSDEELDGLITHAADMVIEELKGRNILVEDGARLKLRFHLDKMQPTLNGEPLSL